MYTALGPFLATFFQLNAIKLWWCKYTTYRHGIIPTIKAVDTIGNCSK